jgi:preprotein translocase subunit SecD
MIDELELLEQLRPEVRPPSEEATADARRSLDRAIAGASRPSRVARRLPGLLVPALGVVITIGVAVVFLSLHVHTASRRSGPVGAHPRNVVLVFRAEANPPRAEINSAEMQRTASVVRERIDVVAPGTQVSARGNELVVRVGRVEPGSTLPSVAQVAALASAPGRLLFYDWEANVLMPNGRTAASQLVTQDPSALRISQGSGAFPTGSVLAGAVPLYQAVQLAAKQRERVSSDNARRGNEYYLFGAPGSSACQTAARDAGELMYAGVHCLLAGPVSLPASASMSDVRGQLSQTMPPGVRFDQGELLTVKQGTVVLQGAPLSFSRWPAFGSPAAGYYVLKDHVGLFGNEITAPHASTDQTGQADVTFGFTSHGQSDYQRLTARIARRGQLSSLGNSHLNQHFAVVLDNQLLTVPQIDFRAYPDGIPGNSGAAIFGAFTTAQARQLATELRAGALPVRFRLLSINGHRAR